MKKKLTAKRDARPIVRELNEILVDVRRGLAELEDDLVSAGFGVNDDTVDHEETVDTIDGVIGALTLELATLRRLKTRARVLLPRCRWIEKQTPAQEQTRTPRIVNRVNL